MKMRLMLGAAVAAALVVAAFSAGCSSSPTRSSSQSTPSAVAPQTTNSDAGMSAGAAKIAPESQVAPSAGAGAQDSASYSGSTPTPDKLVVTTSSMTIEVKDVAKGVEAVRALAAATGSEVADLKFSSGAGGETPQPLDANGAALSSQGPANAVVTMRVPAAKLADAEHRASTLGDVVAQSSTQSDVTQQHVDMSARLANLRAEESQLRTIMSRAGKISDLLQVERELSRVQGDIESMQAQLAYLERQAAMSTLTISLSAPGPLVRPASFNWGFAAAFTAGVQAAAGVARTLITGAIALSPLVVLGLIAWAVVWFVRHRRQRKTPNPQDAE